MTDNACRDCGKPTNELNSIGVCQDCERVRSEAMLKILEEGREVTTVDQLIAALATAETVEEIYSAFAECKPPTDQMEQARVREQLLRALGKKKLSSPTRLVDAWLGTSESEDKIQSTQAGMLVDLVLQHDAVLFHTSDQMAFAAISIDGHREVLAMRSRAFRLWLSRTYYEATELKKVDEEGSSLGAIMALMQTGQARVPGSQALVDAIVTLEGMALFAGEELPVYVRLAHVGDLVYLDLGNEDWSAIEISRSGWQVVATPPVMFRRPSGLGELPIPAPGGTIKELRQHMNVEDDDWPLVVGAILGQFSPGPYAVLVLQGEQGSAKSTAARVIRSIVDPNTAPLRRKPRSDHDLAIAANNSWVINFDNLSALPQWLSDAICTLATGGGFSTRLLYSDDEERLFDSKRPVILNGIGTIATSSDLLDRAILVTLPEIEDKTPEREFWPDFYEALPRILGVILEAIVAALAGAEEITISESVRMVDFARWAMAGLPVLEIDPQGFIGAYAANQRAADLLALEASPIGHLVREFARLKAPWEGTASDLLHELERMADEADGVDVTRDVPGHTRRSKAWPEQPSNLGHELRRLAPNLRRVGVDVQFDRAGHGRTRMTSITLVDRTDPDPGDPPADRLAQGPQNTVRSVRTVRPGTKADPADSADSADSEMHTSLEPAREDEPGAGANGYAPGDIVRRFGGLKSVQFKVKGTDRGNVDCFELEHGQAGKQRTLKASELVLVKRKES